MAYVLNCGIKYSLKQTVEIVKTVIEWWYWCMSDGIGASRDDGIDGGGRVSGGGGNGDSSHKKKQIFRRYIIFFIFTLNCEKIVRKGLS